MAKSNYPPNGSRTATSREQREAHWRKLVEEWRRSGLTQAEFSRRKGCPDSSLGWWVRELKRRDRKRAASKAASQPEPTPTGAFLPVRVLPSMEPTASIGIEIVIGGRTVRIPPGFDPDALRRVIAVLEG